MLVIVAVLFLIIQFVALVMGLALARSITSSIHELFDGHRARAAGRLRAPDQASRRRISSATWPVRSTR